MRALKRAAKFLALAAAGAALFVITGAPTGGGGGGGAPGGGCAAGKVGVGGVCTATPLLGVNNTTAGMISLSMGAARNASSTLQAPYTAHSCPQGAPGVGGGAADFEVDTPDNGNGAALCIDNNAVVTLSDIGARSLVVGNSLTVNDNTNNQDLIVTRDGHIRQQATNGNPPTVGGTCGTSPVGPAQPNGDQGFQFTTGTGSPTACTITFGFQAASTAAIHLICQDRTGGTLVVPTYTSASVITFPSLTASHVIECIGMFN